MEVPAGMSASAVVVFPTVPADAEAADAVDDAAVPELDPPELQPPSRTAVLSKAETILEARFITSSLLIYIYLMQQFSMMSAPFSTLFSQIFYYFSESFHFFANHFHFLIRNSRNSDRE